MLLCKNDGASGYGMLPRQIRKFRVLAQVIHHKTAAGDDLASVGADQFQRAHDQFGGDATATQRARRFGVGDDDRRWRQAIIRERQCALDVEFEAVCALLSRTAACGDSRMIYPFI